MKVTGYTEVGNTGWTAIAFEVSVHTDKISNTDFSLHVTEKDSFHRIAKRIISVETTANGLRINVEPFPYHSNFEMTGSGNANGISFKNEDIDQVITKGLDKFDERQENDVVYRLYSPASKGPRPLLLFLHGGGECGTDNLSQMVETLGAIKLAENYPDVYVMAPQAPGQFELFVPDLSVIHRNTFYTFHQMEGTGWHREYLASICDIIHDMIAKGLVDKSRVYVTGLSMGGGGTLRMLSVGNGLFAAAAPICPTMTPETFQILCSLVDTKLWISTAYVDHTIYRHKYIVDGIMKLRDAGNQNAQLTLYAPEEMEKYGFSTDPDMPLKDKFSQNHNAWVLTYNNEYGIMDWLLSQSKPI